MVELWKKYNFYILSSTQFYFPNKCLFIAINMGKINLNLNERLHGMVCTLHHRKHTKMKGNVHATGAGINQEFSISLLGLSKVSFQVWTGQMNV